MKEKRAIDPLRLAIEIPPGELYNLLCNFLTVVSLIPYTTCTRNTITPTCKAQEQNYCLQSYSISVFIHKHKPVEDGDCVKDYMFVLQNEKFLG